MAAKIKPIGDHVLIELIEERQVEKGGIIIPDNAREAPQQGKVLAVGPGKRDTEGKRTVMEVKAGDAVLIGKYGGTEVEYEGSKYKILREEDILAINVHGASHAVGRIETTLEYGEENADVLG